jgi:hypothetical protein
MQCQEIEPLITFYACQELEGSERAAVEQHLEACAACRLLLEREQRLLAALAAAETTEPSPALLASCRNDLSDALDLIPAEQSSWRRWASAFRLPEWFALHPAWSGAFFLLLGIAVGNIVPGWFRQHVQSGLPSGGSDVVITSAPLPSLDSRSLPVAAGLPITGINWTPGESENPRIEVYLAPEQPRVVQGTLEANEVRRALEYVVTNNQRFDPGLRLDSVELLKSRIDDPEVRGALCRAARNDGNAGVRLKALEAVRGLAQIEEVRAILIDALLNDENRGVRVKSINALRALVEQQNPPADPRLMEVFRDRMQHDSSTYVRLQSAAAMRHLDPRGTY